MPTRKANWSDLLPASHIAAAAFFDDPFSGVFLRPFRHLYPNDSYLYTLRRLRQAYFAPNATILVAESNSLNSNSPTNSITGVSIWTRRGEGGKALLHSQSWFGWLTMRCMIFVNILHAKIYPDRSLDESRFALLLESEPFSRQHFDHPPTRKEGYFLDLCAVDPNCQGKGYGREMVLFGVLKAREDAVVAGLIASTGNEGFYERCGFNVVGYGTEGDGNPLAAVPGGAIMFFEGDNNAKIEEPRKDR